MDVSCWWWEDWIYATESDEHQIIVAERPIPTHCNISYMH